MLEDRKLIQTLLVRPFSANGVYLHLISKLSHVKNHQFVTKGNCKGQLKKLKNLCAGFTYVCIRIGYFLIS